MNTVCNAVTQRISYAVVNARPEPDPNPTRTRSSVLTFSALRRLSAPQVHIKAAAFASLSCLRSADANTLPRTNQPESTNQPQTARAVRWKTA